MLTYTLATIDLKHSSTIHGDHKLLSLNIETRNDCHLNINGFIVLTTVIILNIKSELSLYYWEANIYMDANLLLSTSIHSISMKFNDEGSTTLYSILSRKFSWNYIDWYRKQKWFIHEPDSAKFETIILSWTFYVKNT